MPARWLRPPWRQVSGVSCLSVFCCLCRCPAAAGPAAGAVAAWRESGGKVTKNNRDGEGWRPQNGPAPAFCRLLGAGQPPAGAVRLSRWGRSVGEPRVPPPQGPGSRPEATRRGSRRPRRGGAAAGAAACRPRGVAYFHNKCKLIASSFVSYTYFSYLCGDLDVKETIKFYF